MNRRRFIGASAVGLAGLTSPSAWSQTNLENTIYLDLKDGRFTNTNFDSYNLLRIDQMPQVDVHFALSGGAKWGGMGEPAGPPVPPAVANAIYYATGKRIRSTPFRNHDLSWS